MPTQAMNKLGLKRIIAVTSIGTSETVDNVSWVFKVMRWAFLQDAFRDKNAQEAFLRSTDLDYTIVRPSRLLYAPATGKIAVDETNTVFATQITRADVAAFCIKLATSNEYAKKAVCINNQ